MGKAVEGSATLEIKKLGLSLHVSLLAAADWGEKGGHNKKYLPASASSRWILLQCVEDSIFVCLFVFFNQSNTYLELCCVCFLQVFPPTFRELPGPALDLFDLDESFSSEKSRLAQITNKCKRIKPPWPRSKLGLTVSVGIFHIFLFVGIVLSVCRVICALAFALY